MRDHRGAAAPVAARDAGSCPPLLDRPRECVGPLDATIDGLLDRLDAAAEELEAVDRALRGVPGVLGLLADARGSAAGARSSSTASNNDSQRSSPCSTTAALDPGIARVDQRRAGALPGRPVGDRPRPAAGSCRGRLAAQRRDLGCRRGGAAQPASGALGARPPRGARPRLRRARGAADRPRPRSGRPVDRRGARARGPTGRSAPVRRCVDDAGLVVVYKAAAEIGELGDNTAALRESLRTDELLHRALRLAETSEAVVLGHTRWASIGIVSEPNAHPQSSEELGGCRRPVRHRRAQRRRRQLRGPLGRGRARRGPRHHHRRQGDPDPRVTSARRGRQIPTTRSARRSRARGVGGDRGDDPGRARTTCSLALRGSGQALYVGLAEDAFIVAVGALRRGRGDVALPAHGR